MNPPAAGGTTRLAVPIPPFQPKQVVPAPAPIAPSATGPPVAFSIAARTCSARTWRPWMSFRYPSLVSPTTTVTVPVAMPISGLSRMACSTKASATSPTFSVLVSAMGDSITPSSRICSNPTTFPTPLIVWTAARTFSRNRLPPWGRMTVTPVRTGPCPGRSGPSPAWSVTCPTRTPGTSVIALSRPTGNSPTINPASRARGRPPSFPSPLILLSVLPVPVPVPVPVACRVSVSLSLSLSPRNEVSQCPG